MKIYKVDTCYQLHSQRIISCINVLIKYLTGESFFTFLGILVYLRMVYQYLQIWTLFS